MDILLLLSKEGLVKQWGSQLDFQTQTCPSFTACAPCEQKDIWLPWWQHHNASGRGWWLDTICLGLAAATRDLCCIPEVHRLMGPILFGKACAAYTASVKPVCLLLDMTALLDELPRRTKANDWTCSGLGRSASTLCKLQTTSKHKPLHMLAISSLVMVSLRVLWISQYLQ